MVDALREPAHSADDDVRGAEDAESVDMEVQLDEAIGKLDSALRANQADEIGAAILELAVAATIAQRSFASVLNPDRQKQIARLLETASDALADTPYQSRAARALTHLVAPAA